MPIFLVERRYADALEVSAQKADGINQINAEEDVRWLYSLLSKDRRKPTAFTKPSPSPHSMRL